jgi:hypothetical protein
VAPVATLVWVLGSIFLLNLFVAGWLVTLELVERHRLDKEIKEVDALWRSMTMPVTAVWGAQGQARRRRRVASLRRLPSIPTPVRKAAVGFALASTVLGVLFAAPDPASQPTIHSADGVEITAFPPWWEEHLGSLSDAPSATDSSPPSPSSQDGSTGSSEGATVPASVAARARSSTAIHLVWGDVPAAIKYEVDRMEQGTTQRWTTIARVEESAYTDVHLDAATTYFYRITTLIDGGAAMPSDIVSATTSAVAAPDATSVNAAATLDTVTLTWTDVANETGYRIERSLDGINDWMTVGTAGQDVTTSIDTQLTPTTTFYYRIIATNVGGDSMPSNVVAATTEILPITDPTPVVTPAPSDGGAAAVDVVPVADGTLALDASVAPEASVVADASVVVEDSVALEASAVAAESAVLEPTP